MLYLAVFLFIAALVLLWVSARQKKSSGLPGGRVIYTDTRAWKATEKPLYDPVTGLTGKPDYLVENNGKIIPVEVKTSRRPDAPYDSHIFQLAAYCLLVENTLDTRPPYGVLHYSSRSGEQRTFAIDYTKELQDTLVELLEEMRENDRRKSLHRSHESPARCARCGYRSICDEALE